MQRLVSQTTSTDGYTTNKRDVLCCCRTESQSLSYIARGFMAIHYHLLLRYIHGCALSHPYVHTHIYIHIYTCMYSCAHRFYGSPLPPFTQVQLITYKDRQTDRRHTNRQTVTHTDSRTNKLIQTSHSDTKSVSQSHRQTVIQTYINAHTLTSLISQFPLLFPDVQHYSS